MFERKINHLVELFILVANCGSLKSAFFCTFKVKLKNFQVKPTNLWDKCEDPIFFVRKYLYQLICALGLG